MRAPRPSAAGSLQDSSFDAAGSIAGTTAVQRAVPPAGGAAPPAPPASGATLIGAMLSLDYWLMFVALIIGTGAGLSVINNVGSLAQSVSVCVWGVVVEVQPLEGSSLERLAPAPSIHRSSNAWARAA